jgi:hypothetical protein
MSALDNKAAYLKELSRAAEFLTGNYLEEVQQLLPGKSLNRIKNARSGQVQDQEVLTVLKSIAERERVKRREKALEELRLTKRPLLVA